MQRSDLNGFLFGEVGVEASGMQLTVLSTLARLGVDPWQEAGRLAELPIAAAVDGLARMIAAMPACPGSLADTTAIAARLVDMLPVRSGGLFGHGTAEPPVPSSLQATRRHTVVLALATVLTGLILNLVGQRGAALDAIARQPANEAKSPATSFGHPSTKDWRCGSCQTHPLGVVGPS